MSDCSNCASLLAENSHLRAEVRRLEIENHKLRIKIKKLEYEIGRLLRLIYSVCQYCCQVARDAAGQMKNHQARGTWGYLRGRYEVASAVYSALRGEVRRLETLWKNLLKTPCKII